LPTPRYGYTLPTGEPCPSVTTVLKSLGWNRDALMHWSWQEGVAGRDYRQSRQRDANIGTLAHARIEAHLLNQPYTEPIDIDPAMVALADQAFTAFLDWMHDKDVSIFRTEQAIVCPRYRFGGTLDAVGQVDGRFVLLDWKTSKRVFAEYVLQVAAYRHLWNAYGATYPHLIADEAVIVRVGKDGTFTAFSMHADDLDQAFNAFTALLRVHARKEAIAAMVKPPDVQYSARLPVVRREAS
jgi:hypothetical protein